MCVSSKQQITFMKQRPSVDGSNYTAEFLDFDKRVCMQESVGLDSHRKHGLEKEEKNAEIT